MTQHLFKDLHYPVAEKTGDHKESPARPLTHEEQNALRYVAGYAIHTRLESSPHQKEDEMIVLLSECAGDESDENGGTETWTDRGGLWHITYLS